MSSLLPDLNKMIMERLEPNSLKDAARTGKEWRHYIQYNAHKMRSIDVDIMHLTLISPTEIRVELAKVQNNKIWLLEKPIGRMPKYEPLHVPYDPHYGVPIAYLLGKPPISRIVKYKVKELRISFRKYWSKDEQGLRRLNSYLPEWWTKRIKRLFITLNNFGIKIPIPLTIITSRFSLLDEFVLVYQYIEVHKKTKMEFLSTPAVRHTLQNNCISTKIKFWYFAKLTEQSKKHPIRAPAFKGPSQISLSSKQLIYFLQETQFMDGFRHLFDVQNWIGSRSDWFQWKSKNTSPVTEEQTRLYRNACNVDHWNKEAFSYKNMVFMVDMTK